MSSLSLASPELLGTPPTFARRPARAQKGARRESFNMGGGGMGSGKDKKRKRKSKKHKCALSSSSLSC